MDQSGSLNLSLTGLDPYDWEHEITNEDGIVVCLANQSTCIESDVAFDLSSVNFNEWSASFSVTMALEANLNIYRIGFVDGEKCHNGEDIQACGQMEAFPSDLLRLIIGGHDRNGSRRGNFEHVDTPIVECLGVEVGQACCEIDGCCVLI